MTRTETKKRKAIEIHTGSLFLFTVRFRPNRKELIIALNSTKNLSVSGSQIVQVAPADAILYTRKNPCILQGPGHVMILPLCKIISASSSFIWIISWLFICDVYTGNPIQQRWFKRRPESLLYRTSFSCIKHPLVVLGTFYLYRASLLIDLLHITFMYAT